MSKSNRYRYEHAEPPTPAPEFHVATACTYVAGVGSNFHDHRTVGAMHHGHRGE
jgi:hypothetical protein